MSELFKFLFFCKQLVFTFSNFVSVRDDKINLHPAFANTYARFSPIPLDAPVIHTTFPSKESKEMLQREVNF